MKKSTWFWFSLMRIAAFAIPLVVMLFLGIEPWIAALLAAIIGLCISYIFFARTRNSLSQALYESRQAKKAENKDEETEDALVDAALEEEDPRKA
jgi:membrane protein implicated in regulation of membrane protease activity